MFILDDLIVLELFLYFYGFIYLYMLFHAYICV